MKLKGRSDYAHGTMRTVRYATLIGQAEGRLEEDENSVYHNIPTRKPHTRKAMKNQARRHTRNMRAASEYLDKINMTAVYVRRWRKLSFM